MLKNEKLIHRLTLEQKISLIVSDKEYVREQVDDYEFPVFSLLEKPYELIDDNKTVVFPDKKTIAKSWNEELIKNVYNVLGNENDRLSNEMFMLTNTTVNTNFIDDQYLLGNFISAQVNGLKNSCSKAVLEKSSHCDNYELSMLANDIAVSNSDVEYILVNEPEDIKYCKETDEYKKEFIAIAEYKEMVTKFLSYGVSMIFYKGDFNELKEYLTNAVNNYNIQLQAYQNNQITLAQFNGFIDSGKIIAQETLDKACDHMIDLFIKVRNFRNKEKLNEFISKENIDKDLLDYEEVAKEASREGIVLLKNNDNALPLKYGESVAIIGEPFENTDYLKSQLSITPTSLQNGYDLIDKYEEISYTGYAHGYLLDGEEKEELVNKSIKLTTESDKVLLYLQVCKDEDTLRENQLNLLDELSKTGKKIIVVLLTDHYVQLDFIDKCDAVLYCENLGQFTHEAILDVVTGRFDATGRLTSEYPILLSDLSADDNDIPSYCFDKPCLYPFGYGLSYADCELSKLEVTEKDVCFNVINNSDIDGVIIPQLYICKEHSSSSLAYKLLKGYTRVEVRAHETIKVRIPLDEQTFRYFIKESMSYGCEGGDYNIYIGLDAHDIRLNGTLNLKSYANKMSEDQKVIQEELEEANIVSYLAEQKSKTMSKKSKTIILTILMVYILLSDVLLIGMGDINTDTTISFIILGVVLEIICLIQFIKVRKIKEVKVTQNDPNLTLTKMIDNVQCFNPIVTYKYDNEQKVVEEELPNVEEEEETFEQKEEELESNVEITTEENSENTEENKEPLLEEVEKEPTEEVMESIYDEEASLSLEEIEKFEEEEMKILEEQEIAKLSEFEEVVEEEIKFDTEVSVNQIINNFAKFAKSNGLVIELNSIRSLFSALAGSKMIFLTTNNEEHTDDLLEIINKFFGNRSNITTANENWASLFSISWTKNENGEYIKTPFIQDIYKAGLLKNNFNLSIIKNVDLDNFELYFKRCIDFANNPTRNISLDISKQIRVFIPHNMHFIVVPRDRDYIKNITRNLAEASTFVDIVVQEVVAPTEIEDDISYISDKYFGQLIHESLKGNYLSEASWKKIDELLEEISKQEEIELPNKSVLQIERYSAIFMNAGGDEVDLLDRVLANKVIPLIKSLEITRTEEGYKFTKELLERIFGAENIKLTLSVLALRDTLIL